MARVAGECTAHQGHNAIVNYAPSRITSSGVASKAAIRKRCTAVRIYSTATAACAATVERTICKCQWTCTVNPTTVGRIVVAECTVLDCDRIGASNVNAAAACVVFVAVFDRETADRRGGVFPFAAVQVKSAMAGGAAAAAVNHCRSRAALGSQGQIATLKINVDVFKAGVSPGLHNNRVAAGGVADGVLDCQVGIARTAGVVVTPGGRDVIRCGGAHRRGENEECQGAEAGG